MHFCIFTINFSIFIIYFGFPWYIRIQITFDIRGRNKDKKTKQLLLVPFKTEWMIHLLSFSLVKQPMQKQLKLWTYSRAGIRDRKDDHIWQLIYRIYFSMSLWSIPAYFHLPYLTYFLHFSCFYSPDSFCLSKIHHQHRLGLVQLFRI